METKGPIHASNPPTTRVIEEETETLEMYLGLEEQGHGSKGTEAWKRHVELEFQRIKKLNIKILEYNNME